MGKGILLFGNHPPPFGGVPAHIQYLAPYLTARGWNVHVLSMEGNTKWGFACSEVYDGYTIHRPSKALRLSKLFQPALYASEAKVLKSHAYPKAFLGTLALANYVKEIVINHDIEIISAYHIFGAGLVSAMVCRELSIPLITSVFGEIYSQPDFHKQHLDEVKYVINTSRKILSCSKHCANSFETIGLHPEVEAVYYGIDTQQFNPDSSPETVRKNLGIGNKEKVVIFVARMVREMGLHVLLDAIPLVLATDENITFIIVGRSGELLPSAQKVASQYPKQVFVVPDASFEELPLYYAAATIAVIPSINDRACLGLAIAEAMATGKPVIVSNIGGGPEVVTAGETGSLVPPNDSKALADEILKVLMFDEDTLQKMGQLGRERAVAVFDKEATNRRMEQIFLEALK